MPNIPYILSVLIFLPSVAAIVLGFIPNEKLKAIRYLSLFASILNFAVSLLVLAKFSNSTFHFQMTEYVEWIPSLGIHYRIGVDGISIWLIVLTTFLSFISTWFSFNVKQRVKNAWSAC